MKGLRECPFCGNKKTLVLSTASENGEYGIDTTHKCICCDFTNGGCGGCGGYYENAEKATDAWNKRTR